MRIIRDDSVSRDKVPDIDHDRSKTVVLVSEIINLYVGLLKREGFIRV